MEDGGRLMASPQRRSRPFDGDLTIPRRRERSRHFCADQRPTPWSFRPRTKLPRRPHHRCPGTTRRRATHQHRPQPPPHRGDGEENRGRRTAPDRELGRRAGPQTTSSTSTPKTAGRGVLDTPGRHPLPSQGQGVTDDSCSVRPGAVAVGRQGTAGVADAGNAPGDPVRKLGRRRQGLGHLRVHHQTADQSKRFYQGRPSSTGQPTAPFGAPVRNDGVNGMWRARSHPAGRRPCTTRLSRPGGQGLVRCRPNGNRRGQRSRGLAAGSEMWGARCPPALSRRGAAVAAQCARGAPRREAAPRWCSRPGARTYLVGACERSRQPGELAAPDLRTGRARPASAER